MLYAFQNNDFIFTCARCTCTLNKRARMIKINYTYDRIILLNTTYFHEYIMNSVDVFYFDSVYDII